MDRHAQEPEVIKIKALPKKSMERKYLLASLRSRGNLLKRNTDAPL